MLRSLVVFAGTDQGRVFPLADEKPLVIGRGDGTDTRLRDPLVSRTHCQVQVKGEEVVVSDAGSSGGTLVNGLPVKEHVLKAGDVIQIGNTCLRYELQAAPTDTTVVTPYPPGILSGPPIRAGEAPVLKHLKSMLDRGVLILTITESQVLDEETADGLGRELLAAFVHSGLGQIIVDFRAIKYVADVVFRPLLSLRDLVQKAGGKLVLCGMSPALSQVFFLAQLISSDPSASAPFLVKPDLAAAQAHLGQG